MRRKQLIGILIGSLIFGFLMAIRQEMAGLWQRTAIAGIAGLVLGLTISFSRKRSNT